MLPLELPMPIMLSIIDIMLSIIDIVLSIVDIVLSIVDIMLSMESIGMLEPEALAIVLTEAGPLVPDARAGADWLRSRV